MSAPVPSWILADSWRELHPPAEVLKLGELPRSPEKLLAATRLLCVLTALRYVPDGNATPGTRCNIYASDALQILNAKIDHVFDLKDGRGPRELRANDMVDGLRARRFSGWLPLGSMASWKAAEYLAGTGQPVIATWKNPQLKLNVATGKPLKDARGDFVYHSGHVVIVVPTPPGAKGLHVTGAGRTCVQECPIAKAFGPYLNAVELWEHRP